MRQSPLCDSERFVDDFQTMLEQVAELKGLRPNAQAMERTAGSGTQAVSVNQGAPA